MGSAGRAARVLEVREGAAPLARDEVEVAVAVEVAEGGVEKSPCTFRPSSGLAAPVSGVKSVAFAAAGSAAMPSRAKASAELVATLRSTQRR
jgi:hypothetical protein